MKKSTLKPKIAIEYVLLKYKFLRLGDFAKDLILDSTHYSNLLLI